MTDWRRSRRSGGETDQACVELARLAARIGVRDSKNVEAPHLSLAADAFGSLVKRVKRGELDL